MSKRFKFKEILQQSSGITDNGRILTYDEVVMKLNQLHEENIQLRKELSKK